MQEKISSSSAARSWPAQWVVPFSLYLYYDKRRVKSSFCPRTNLEENLEGLGYIWQYILTQVVIQILPISSSTLSIGFSRRVILKEFIPCIALKARAIFSSIAQYMKHIELLDNCAVAALGNKDSRESNTRRVNVLYYQLNQGRVQTKSHMNP